MVAISRSRTAIAIVPAGTAASALADSDFIRGQIKSYSKSGGEQDVESDPHFGGFVDKEKARSQVELEFEVTPDLDDADRWNSIAYSEDPDNTGLYLMSGSLTDRAVYIGHSDGTKGQAYGFNNCNVTMLDLEHNADDNQTGTLNMKFSPTNASGISNFMTKSSSANITLAESAPVQLLPAWTSLDSD